MPLWDSSSRAVAASSSLAQPAGMSAAIALILLAQTAAPCTPLGSRPLAGRAVVIRPVTTLEVPPFERLGPATSVRKKPQGIQRTGASSETDDRDTTESAQHCEAVVTIA